MLLQEVSNTLVDLWKKHCEEGDYVFLSKKDPLSGRWTDQAFVVDDKLNSSINRWMENNPPDRYHLYWCPLPFISPRRQKRYVRGSQYLWSDLDEVDIKALPIKPSIYWESSPGRFQGLWVMDEFLAPQDAEDLSKELAYKLGADKSGWDLTQVLRIPGTKNHKYKDLPDVGETIYTDKVYSTKDLPTIETPEMDDIRTPVDLNVREILAKYRVKIPRKALNLLLSKNVSVGKRSDMLWYLEQTLLDCGLKLPEIFTLVKHSEWNKYRGRSDEDERLRVELTKIMDGRVEEDEPPTKEQTDFVLGLEVASYSDLMSGIASNPGWLVEGCWTRQSHGIVAGEPKSFKSILTLDMAISIASGKPFLGQFEVHEQGPVLIVQNENSDWIMKDRVAKIISHKGLVGNMKVDGRKLVGKFAPVLPIDFINSQGFQFGDPIHREIVEKLIAQSKPILVIFDPLYLMFEGELNSAKELNPALTWLLSLKQRFNTGILLVHHWNKGGTSSRGGQRMLGSTTLHGWVESAWYIKVNGQKGQPDFEDEAGVFVDRPSGEPVEIVIEREFRGAGTYPKLEATLRLGEPGNPSYKVDLKKHVGRGSKAVTPDLTSDILNILELSQTRITQRALSEETGVGRKAIKRLIEELLSTGKIDVNNKGVLFVGEEVKPKNATTSPKK